MLVGRLAACPRLETRLVDVRQLKLLCDCLQLRQRQAVRQDADRPVLNGRNLEHGALEAPEERRAAVGEVGCLLVAVSPRRCLCWSALWRA